MLLLWLANALFKKTFYFTKLVSFQKYFTEKLLLEKDSLLADIDAFRVHQSYHGDTDDRTKQKLLILERKMNNIRSLMKALSI